MKKVLSLVIAFTMVFTVFGFCGGAFQKAYSAEGDLVISSGVIDTLDVDTQLTLTAKYKGKKLSSKNFKKIVWTLENIEVSPTTASTTEEYAYVSKGKVYAESIPDGGTKKSPAFVKVKVTAEYKGEQDSIVFTIKEIAPELEFVGSTTRLFKGKKGTVKVELGNDDNELVCGSKVFYSVEGNDQLVSLGKNKNTDKYKSATAKLGKKVNVYAFSKGNAKIEATLLDGSEDLDNAATAQHTIRTGCYAKSIDIINSNYVTSNPNDETMVPLKVVTDKASITEKFKFSINNTTNAYFPSVDKKGRFVESKTGYTPELYVRAGAQGKVTVTVYANEGSKKNKKVKDSMVIRFDNQVKPDVVEADSIYKIDLSDDDNRYLISAVGSNGKTQKIPITGDDIMNITGDGSMGFDWKDGSSVENGFFASGFNFSSEDNSFCLIKDRDYNDVIVGIPGKEARTFYFYEGDDEYYSYQAKKGGGYTLTFYPSGVLPQDASTKDCLVVKVSGLTNKKHLEATCGSKTATITQSGDSGEKYTINAIEKLNATFVAAGEDSTITVSNADVDKYKLVVKTY